MPGNPKSAYNGTEVATIQGPMRIRVCSIALSSGAPHLGNLQWSELGQALVVTDEYIVILSPLTGLHPTLAGQSRTQGIECHPDWHDRFPHSVAEISIKTFLDGEQTVRRRIILESDHSAVDPRFQNVQWASACWSRPGLGPHTGCLILATTSELDLFVLGAPLNAWTGEWKLLQAISLDPVADLVELDAAAASDGKDVFSQSRALLRKKQMATEVTCASFLDLPGRNGDSDEPASSSTYIIAGTRSGHIGVWGCDAITGHFNFVSAVSVSLTSIDKFIVSSDVEDGQRGLQARIAIKDEDGVVLYGLYVVDGHADVRLLTAAPIHSERGLITAWRWVKHRLIYATVSRFHVYDAHTQQSATVAVGTGPFDSLDPFSPVIDIRPSPDSDSEVKAVLLDLREYTIAFVPPEQVDSEYEVVEPTLPSTLSGYPPMTENLQRKHIDHQAFLGYAIEPSSRLSSAWLAGGVRTDEKVAFMGYNSSDVLCYQLEVLCKGSVVPASLLDQALASTATGTPTYLAARIVLALLYIFKKQQDKIRNQLVSAIENKWAALASISADAKRPQQQLLYLLACRLQESASDSPPPFDALIRSYRESVLRDWLQRWTPQSVMTDEQCAACNTQLALSWNEQRQYFGWAKCQKGHVWPRCSLSLATISDREVRVCTGCWAKALVPHKQGQGPWQNLMLRSECLYCGSSWIVR
ncbi:uncharacterized protein SRS1_13782 [Sporisorium reilianum f. sp. reilianum]|uniref:Transcription factor IIIC 90kDa subunit N-terminal domain-containing protein n=1 Tax=Sporisorium reilianum f. sp. reilianum TaxID=72559 RepID=A0A2N8UDY3_9BASI|nr:uncharacterized protein SRS1_13782 [Sporisorium reilianum f. sp. reilianum]